ncbi:glycerate kinase [uncultured Clostridium sp.]|uniref:glycerate kinase family protein n=1 Tax=uncultured Clostridium sp. TaxID=59620 RepID=UPI002627A257|nr:glycerate kinase [uncultured Clostridium sp.]
MKFVLATDSFKESMTSIEACKAMESGIKKIIKDAECVKIPIADGGEGTVEALVYGTKGKFEEREVTSPIKNKKVKARYGILGNEETAVIEMAAASGLEILKNEERNPLKTTTFGTGELILDALDKDIKHLIIGIGGSATNDGGVGMLMALGVKFYDKDKREIDVGGEELLKLEKIDISNLDKRLKNIKIEVACDVNNPIIGEEGATKIFGPQKGATPEMVKVLEKALENYTRVIKKDFNLDVTKIKGGGAAGGLGVAFLVFLNGKLEKGINLVIKYSGLEKEIKNADFVFTGEGAIDFQTRFGKTPIGVANVAKKNGVRVIAFGGKVDSNIGELYKDGIDAIFSIMQGVEPIENALKHGPKNLEITVENVVRLLNIL